MKEARLRLQRTRDDLSAFERQQNVALQQLVDSIAFHTQELERQRQDVETKRRLASKGLVAGSEVERAEASSTPLSSRSSASVATTNCRSQSLRRISSTVVARV